MGKRTASGWRWSDDDGNEYEEDNNGSVWELGKRLDDDSEAPQKEN